MPSTQTELFGTVWDRRAAYLADLSQFRIIVSQSVAGVSGAFFRAQYSTDGGGSWIDLEASGTTTDLAVGTGTGLKVGSWGTLATAAIADVQLRLVGQGGDGATDPSFRYISIEFK